MGPADTVRAAVEAVLIDDAVCVVIGAQAVAHRFSAKNVPHQLFRRQGRL